MNSSSNPAFHTTIYVLALIIWKLHYSTTRFQN